MSIEEVIKTANERVEGHALVVVSGGQDSITSLYYALRKYSKVSAIHFQYGQRHAIEEACCRDICGREKVDLKVIILSEIFANIKSALLDTTSDINKVQANGLPASFVPNRNQIFLTVAHAYAQTIGATVLVTGVCETDYSGYPDCRRDFINQLESVTYMGSRAWIKIDTPLMFIDKADTFRLAEALGALPVVLNSTMTCYNGELTPNDWGYGCGRCPACALRLNGYYEYRKRYHSGS